MAEILKSVFRIFLWIVSILIGLVIIIVLLLQFPGVQNYLADFAVKNINKRLNTDIRLDKISIVLPDAVTLTNFYMSDNQNDTLAYFHKMGVNVDLFRFLFKKELEVNSFSLSGAKFYVTRAADSTFNFPFGNNETEKTDESGTEESDNGLNRIGIQEIDLKNVDFFYRDHTNGSLMKGSIGMIDLVFSYSDILNNVFHVNKLDIKNSDVFVSMQTGEENSEDTSNFDMDITLRNRILVQNTRLEYVDKSQENNIILNAGRILLDPDDINLKEKVVGISSFEVENTIVRFETADTSSSNESVPAQSDTSFSMGEWNIWADRIKMEDNHLVYSLTSVPAAPGMDFNHLDLSGFNLDIRDVSVQDNLYGATLRNLSFTDHSGFSISSLSAGIRVSEDQAQIEELVLVTPNSRIKNTTRLKFNSFEQLQDSIGKVFISSDINDTKIGFTDLYYFQPGLRNEIGYTPQAIRINGELSGRVNDLSVKSLSVKYGENSISFSGNITGLPQFENAFFNADLQANLSEISQITGLLPDSTVPSGIHMPENILITSEMNGSLSRFNGTIRITTDQGKMMAKFNGRSDNNDLFYTADFNIGYDLGRLTGKTDTLGQIALNGSVSGKSGENTAPEIDASVNIDSVGLLGYTYRNISADALLRDSVLESRVTAADKNINFILNSKINMTDTVPAFNVSFNLKAADLQAIRLSEDDIRLKGLVLADFKGTDPALINGEVRFEDFLFLKENQRYVTSEVLIKAGNDDSISTLHIESDFLKADYKGTVPLTELPVLLQHHINEYITFDKSLKDTFKTGQNFTFTAQINNTGLLSDVLVPGLNSFAEADLTARYNEENHSMTVDVNVPEINYNDIRISSLSFNVNSDRKQMEYSAGFDRVSFSDFLIENTSWEGSVMNDSMYSVFIIEDSLNKEKYHVESALLQEESGFRLRIIPADFLLNYEEWNIPYGNFVFFGNNGIRLNDFRISNNEKLFVAATPSGSTADGPFTLKFSGILLQDLLSAVQSQQEIVSGELNGNVELTDQNENLYFTSDLSITDLQVFGTEWFQTIRIKAQKEDANTVSLASSFTGNSNNMEVNGTYTARNESNFINISADISRFDLATLKPALSEQFNTFSGILSGSVKVDGNMQDPEIQGRINLNDIHVNPVQLNSDYLIQNETIELNNKRLTLNDFTIQDAAGNLADFDGFVRYDTSGLISFNLKATADQFNLLNAPQSEETNYYGKVIADLDASITGTSIKPVVTVRATVAEGSEFHYTMLSTGDVSIEKEGIVEFVSQDTLASSILEKNDESIAGSGIETQLDLTANIEIQDNALLELVIDPTTNENLIIKGQGNLGVSIQPGNIFTLTGRYEINEGSYTLSLYNVVKRTFEIDKGSSLTWAGDPLQPNADISAIYRVRTSSMGLISDQVQEISPENRKQYENQTQFLVYLNIKGDLLTPKIDFDIKVPEGESNALVSSKLNQLNQNESELNKQVFSLLLFKNFLAGQTSPKPVSYEINETARQGISNILSQQLNNFADQYLQGFDVSFDLTSYAGDDNSSEYSGNTELQVDVSKEFFNDRLSVQVGGNVGIEGSDNEPGDDMNGITGDLVIEYDLTKDGDLKLQGFDKSEYEDLLDGRVRKTGIAFIFSREFFSLRELFKGKKEKELAME